MRCASSLKCWVHWCWFISKTQYFCFVFVYEQRCQRSHRLACLRWSSLPSSQLPHSSFIMSLDNERPGHNKTSHTTQSHEQSNVPSRAPHNFIGRNKHKWCPACVLTFAASGCLKTGLLPPFFFFSSLDVHKQQIWEPCISSTPSTFCSPAVVALHAKGIYCYWESTDGTWRRCEGGRRSAGLESRDSAPHTAKTWQWGKSSPSITPMLLERQHRPSITVTNSSLFIYLLWQAAQRGHTRP